jgi:uncharacterized integral membrane protein (TIGR00697 family)
MDKKLSISLTLYLSALLASNTLGIKLMPFLFGTHLSTAIFAFPIVFLLTDVVGEIYGRATSRMFVRMGLYSTIIFLLFNLLSNLVPSSAAFSQQSAYQQIFGLSFRFALASMVAFVIGEYQDVFTFFLLRKLFRGRWFGLRSTLSNVWSQLLDSVIWFTIAYAGVYSAHTIILTLIPWWLFKVGMGVIYLPFSYLGLRLLRPAHDYHRVQNQPVSSPAIAE